MADYSKLVREANKQVRAAKRQARESDAEVRKAKKAARDFPGRDLYVLSREVRKARRQALASESAAREAQKAVRQVRRELAQEREKEDTTLSPEPSPEDVRKRRDERREMESAV